MDTLAGVTEVLMRSVAMNTDWELKQAFEPAKRNLLWAILGLCLGHFAIRFLIAFGVIEPLSTGTLLLALCVPMLIWLGCYRWQTHRAQSAWIADLSGRPYQAFMRGYVTHIDDEGAHVAVMETTHKAVEPVFVIADFSDFWLHKVGAPFIYRVWREDAVIKSETLSDATVSRTDVLLHRLGSWLAKK